MKRVITSLTKTLAIAGFAAATVLSVQPLGATTVAQAAEPAVSTVGAANASASSIATAETAIDACEVVDATLNWGTLERWRAYISGSIAHGEWQLDGASYELPEFVWQGGSGALTADGTNGLIEFDGSVLFSGHDELLKVSVANPSVEIDGNEAYLLLDLTSTTPTGETDVTATQEVSAVFDLSDAASLEDGNYAISAAPGTLTDEGAAAFGGFYDGGEEVDALSLSATVSADCLAAVNSNATDQGGAESSDSGLPTGAWIAIGAGAVVIGGLAGIMIAKRGRKA